jgi:conjugative transfer signal peptidase TraF
MIGRALVLATMLAGVAGIAQSATIEFEPVVIWNASASVPVGLYRVRPADKLRITDLVVVKPPEQLANFLAARGYLPHHVPLLKRVLALPGQVVCRDGFTITVAGIEMGEAREFDGHHRPLPTWRGCQMVAEGDVFLMNWQSADSFDGRYVGTLPIASIVGRAEPLWTFEE